MYRKYGTTWSENLHTFYETYDQVLIYHESYQILGVYLFTRVQDYKINRNIYKLSTYMYKNCYGKPTKSRHSS